jgi:hypothetical protein
MKPRWVVCEDGDEYRTRFASFLGREFEFVAARDFASAQAALAGAAGLLLDLDFRRTDPGLLVDERGHPAAPGDRARAAEVQGIFILRALRQRGVRIPALLCADLDDARHVDELVRDLAPLQIVAGSEAIDSIARRMRAAAARS